MKLKILIVALIGLLSSKAFAIFDIELVGGGNTATLNHTLGTVPAGQTENDSASSGSGLEYGVFIELNDGIIGLQSGALFLTRKSTVTANISIPAVPISGTVVQTNTINSIQIPLLIRLTPLPYISIGAGAAYNMPQGSVSEDITDPAKIDGGTTSKSQSYDDASIQKGDFAAVGDFQIRVPLGPGAHLTLDGQYQKGLTDMNTSGKATDKMDLVLFMAGLGFGF